MSYDNLTFSIETITPDDASKYLESNVENNRPISDRHVASLARDMREGNWANNGETIKICPQGSVLDGQHRLWACVESKRPFTTAVVRGVENLDNVDRNRPRSLGNALHMRGYERAPRLAIALNTCWRWENTNWRSSTDKPTVSEAVRFLNDNFQLINAAMRYGLKIKLIEGSLEAAALVFWRLSKVVGAKTAMRWFEQLAKSEWDDVNDPLFRYYEMAMKAKGMSRRPHKLMRLNWLIRAIDAKLNNEKHPSARFLRWDIGRKLRLLTGEQAIKNNNIQKDLV